MRLRRNPWWFFVQGVNAVIMIAVGYREYLKSVEVIKATKRGVDYFCRNGSSNWESSRDGNTVYRVAASYGNSL